jgi:hypothetical protein
VDHHPDLVAGCPTARAAIYSLLILAILAAFVVVYVWSPWWIDGARLRMLSVNDESTALVSDRDEVLKILAGCGGVIAVLYTIRRHKIDRRTLEATQKRDAETVRLTTEAQITDRYIKAIGLLAGEKPDERLGGIYALERLMADSSRDQPTIVEVLAAFVRQRTLVPAQTDLEAPTSLIPVVVPPAGAAPQPAADVTAAVTVLARRPREESKHVIDLRRTNLVGLELGHLPSNMVARGATYPRLIYVGRTSRVRI